MLKDISKHRLIQGFGTYLLMLAMTTVITSSLEQREARFVSMTSTRKLLQLITLAYISKEAGCMDGLLTEVTDTGLS